MQRSSKSKQQKILRNVILREKNRQIFKSVERLNFTKLPTAKNGDFLEMFFLVYNRSENRSLNRYGH